MSRFELTFWNDAVSHYTITESSNQSVVSRTLEWNENRPRKLAVVLDNRTTVAASNLLSASFAGWDGAAAALDIGDMVNYFVYPESAPTTKTEVFWGIITELSQTSGGLLTVVARDYLEKFEYIQPNVIVFGNYRDLAQKGTTEYVGTRGINGINETGIVWPPVFVGVATTDDRTTLTGTGVNYIEIMKCTGGTPNVYEWFAVAQSFCAKGDGVIGIHYNYSTWDISVAGNIYCAIQADVGGLPSGVNIASSSLAISTGTITDEPVQVDFTDELSSCSVQIEKGKKYWVVWTCDNTIRCTDAASGHVGIIYHTSVPANPFEDYYWRKGIDPVVAWTKSPADRNCSIIIDFADYVEVVPEDYYLSGTTIVCKSDGAPIVYADGSTTPMYYSLNRGKVSFYYGTVTTEDIFKRLIGFEQAVYPVVDTDCDTAYSLYQTRGKSAGECLRELADTFETTGAKSGYQHIVAAYLNDDDDDIVHVGFGPYTGSRTFAHGADSTTDNELRIKSVDLKLATTLRPASVVVIGKASDGSPIIVQRDDRALSASFRTRSKMALLTTHTDESIRAYADADRKAWQILDSYRRGVWEGSIEVAGVFPDLFDLNTASESYGAGGHIHLKYSPLAINNDEFHVRGIVLHENTTELQISNEDILALNALTDARGRAERSESFIAPDDPFTTVFVSDYSGSVLTTATLYMQLESDIFDTPITDCVRVKCTKTTNTRYNTVTYHAEFEASNGHTIDGTDKVVALSLYAAASGGSRVGTVALNASERYPKWRTTRVIAEIHCKAA